MTRDGGPMNEPTSYGLQPPRNPPEDGYASGEPSAPPASPGHPPTRATAARPQGEEGAGRLLGGRYQLHSRLGHGGMGTVWRAHDTVVDRDVAVKEPRLPDDLPEREREAMYQRMRREARAAARIEHPAVVTVHDVVVEEERPWIVMELVKGRSLADVLAEGTLDAREAARVGGAVAGALGAAHDAGVLHRDVKPDNVLLGRYDRVVLTDFGIAQVEGEQGLTQTGAFVGSPEFTAPERVLGQRPGPESDLWALGVVLYTATEGHSPFRRNNNQATLQAVLSAEPQSPTRATGALGTTINQLMRKDPGMRPGVYELRRVFEEVARPPLPTAATVTPAGGAGGTGRSRLAALRRSRKAQFSFGGGVLAVAAALALLLVNPFADTGLPEGWQTYREKKQLKASVAVPGDYVRSEDEGLVTYESENGDWDITVSRTTEAEYTSVGEANETLREYTDGLLTFSDFDGTVTSVEHQGEDAARLHGIGNVDGFASKKLVVYELVHVNGNAVEWHLKLAAPGGDKESREKAKRMFEDLVTNFDIGKP